MNSRIFFLIGFLIIIYSVSYSQTEFSLFGAVNYNSYSMTEIKQRQQEFLSSLTLQNIPAEIEQSFPSYFGFKAGILIPVLENETHTLSIGACARHETTGGRIDYHDYTGGERLDMVVKSTGIGAIINYEIHFTSIFSCGFSLTTYYLKSDLSYSYNFNIGDYINKSSDSYNSSSAAFEPEIIPSVNFWILKFGISLSYVFDTLGTLDTKNNPMSFFYYDELKLDWSGFSIGLQGFISI